MSTAESEFLAKPWGFAVQSRADEWHEGFVPRFGLFTVDYVSYARSGE